MQTKGYGKTLSLDLPAVSRKIINLWIKVAEEERELSTKERNYILQLQENTIKQLKEEDDILSQEEMEAENCANKGLDYFKDRDRTKSN